MNHTKAGRAKSRRNYVEIAELDAFLRWYRSAVRITPERWEELRARGSNPCEGCDYCRPTEET